jgi:hypothetical protein
MGAMLVVLCATPTSAHRVDEYLQATTIELWNDHLRLELQLTPGIAVATRVLDSIDVNHDGTISPEEELAYAALVQRDQSLTWNGEPLALTLLSSAFPSVAELRQGQAAIQLAFRADVSHRNGQQRLVAANTHRRAISAYLANALVPADTRLRITAQLRDYEQSVYELVYEQQSARAFTMLAGIVLLIFSVAGPAWYVATKVRRAEPFQSALLRD